MLKWLVAGVAGAAAVTDPPTGGTLAYYYFIDDCKDQRLNVPDGMLDSGNAIMLSFISDDKWSEGEMTNGLDEVAKAIKEKKPDMFVAYSIGGETGSQSESLYTYLSKTPEEDIVKAIMDWQYADGIDWDLEPPSGPTAALYGDPNMANKIASISKKVVRGGKHVSMAGMGSWVWDPTMAELYGALMDSGTVWLYGIMFYVPAQPGTADECVSWGQQWIGGPQVGSHSDATCQANQLAGGISGSASATGTSPPGVQPSAGKLAPERFACSDCWQTPLSTDDATQIAVTYNEAGHKGAIVWMVKPNDCSIPSGWVVDNTQLGQWTKVRDAFQPALDDDSAPAFVFFAAAAAVFGAAMV